MAHIPRYTTFDISKSKEEIAKEAEELKIKMSNKMYYIAKLVKENPEIGIQLAPEIMQTANEADDAIESLNNTIKECRSEVMRKELDMPEEPKDNVITFKNTNAYKDKRVKEIADGFVNELRKLCTRYKRAFDTINYHLLIKYDISLDRKEDLK